MHPTAAAFVSMNWPFEHDASSEPPATCPNANIHAASSPIYPVNSPTRLPEDPLFLARLYRCSSCAPCVLSQVPPLLLRVNRQVRVDESVHLVSDVLSDARRDPRRSNNDDCPSTPRSRNRADFSVPHKSDNLVDCDVYRVSVEPPIRAGLYRIHVHVKECTEGILLVAGGGRP